MFERRTAAERRAPGDRRRKDRRGAEQRFFVVELSEADLHAAVCVRSPAGEGERITACSLRWRHESSRLACPEGTAELTTALRDVAKQLGQTGAGVFIVLGSEFCVNRVFRGSPDQVRTELKQIEQRSRLYLSLGPGPKAVVSHIGDVEARKQYAQALICNQDVLDALQRAVESAGLALTGIEASLNAVNRALARVADVPAGPVLFVQTRDRLATIGIFHRGRLLLDYRPGVNIQPHEVAPRLAAHRSRLERHVARQVEGGADLADVYLETAVGASAALSEGFAAHTEFRVHSADPQHVRGPWKLSEGSDRAVTLALLGGVMGRLAAPGERDAPDLLEHIRERTREPLRPILIRSLMPLAASLALALVLGIVNWRYARQAAVLEAQNADLAAAQARARELQLQLLGKGEKLREMNRLSEQLSGRTGVHLIRQLGGCLPNDVWLERLELSDASRVALRGASFLEAGVYDFVRWLEEAPLVAESALKATSPGSSPTGPLTNFDVELTLAADAWSTPAREGKP